MRGNASVCRVWVLRYSYFFTDVMHHGPAMLCQQSLFSFLLPLSPWKSGSDSVLRPYYPDRHRHVDGLNGQNRDRQSGSAWLNS